MKAGGAKLHVFDNPNSPMSLSTDLVRDAKTIANERIRDVVGYAIVAWSSRGDTSSSLRVVDGRFTGLLESPEFIKTVLINRLPIAD